MARGSSQLDGRQLLIAFQRGMRAEVQDAAIAQLFPESGERGVAVFKIKSPPAACFTAFVVLLPLRAGLCAEIKKP